MLELKTIFKRKFIAFLFLISALTIPVFSQNSDSDNFAKGEDFFAKDIDKGEIVDIITKGLALNVFEC